MSRRERQAWIVAALALLGCGLAWVLAPARFPHAWLAGFVALSLWPLGSLGLLYAHALTGGRWGEAIRPGLLAGAGLAPALAVLVIPLWLSLPALYPWVRADGSLANRWWLNPPFFFVRGAVSLAVWMGLAALAWRGRGLGPLAPFALIALAITVTWSAIDLTMSLDPRFVSSAYGMIAAASAAVVGLACAILASPAAAPEIGNDLGKLLLGLVALWTYLDFMQIVIVFQSDLATQAPWYVARARGPAGWVMALVSVLHSVIPVFALLSPRVRRSPATLSAVASLLVLAELIRAFWTVLPGVRGPGLADAAVAIFVLALGTAWALRARRLAC
jgi:hypothetical protein